MVITLITLMIVVFLNGDYFDDFDDCCVLNGDYFDDFGNGNDGFDVSVFTW